MSTTYTCNVSSCYGCCSISAILITSEFVKVVKVVLKCIVTIQMQILVKLYATLLPILCWRADWNKCTLCVCFDYCEHVLSLLLLKITGVFFLCVCAKSSSQPLQSHKLIWALVLFIRKTGLITRSFLALSPLEFCIRYENKTETFQ